MIRIVIIIMIVVFLCLLFGTFFPQSKEITTTVIKNSKLALVNQLSALKNIGDLPNVLSFPDCFPTSPGMNSSLTCDFDQELVMVNGGLFR